MGGVGVAGLFFLGSDLVFQFSCHFFHFCHHQLDLPKLTGFFVDLKLFQANMALTRLHTQYSRDARSRLMKLVTLANSPVPICE